MTFSATFSEQYFPGEDLRRAALCLDNSLSVEAAMRWMQRTDPDCVVYAQHRLISMMVKRHKEALANEPSLDRYMTVWRQLKLRHRVNLELLKASIPSLLNVASGWCLTGNAAWIAKDFGNRDDSLEVIHLLTERRVFKQVVDALCATGWEVAPVQKETWQDGSIVWLSKGLSGKLWVYLPEQLISLKDTDVQTGTTEGKIGEHIVPVANSNFTTTVAVAQASEGHSLPDQWLFDFYVLAQQGCLRPHLSQLDTPLKKLGVSAFAWAEYEVFC